MLKGNRIHSKKQRTLVYFNKNSFGTKFGYAGAIIIFLINIWLRFSLK